ncbi:hypothetical protein [Lichenicoccus roseus]|uniref:hypothetical protein n=1 Tax=Lichenicoccus roseus TaxID=2683649 RepID=UPI001486BBAA|nr:hypothetical protein [Lichenicoccus roseus]
MLTLIITLWIAAAVLVTALLCALIAQGKRRAAGQSASARHPAGRAKRPGQRPAVRSV